MTHLGKKHSAQIFDDDLEDPREELRLFKGLKKAQQDKSESDVKQAWEPDREDIYGEDLPDRMQRILKFQDYMTEKGLVTNKSNLHDMQMLVLKRSGQSKKPLGFTLAKELREIKIAKHEQNIDKLGVNSQVFK